VIGFDGKLVPSKEVQMMKPIEIVLIVVVVAIGVFAVAANVSRNDERALRFAECSGRSLEEYKACHARVEGSGE
jgi:hypothetical protein